MRRDSSYVQSNDNRKIPQYKINKTKHPISLHQNPNSKRQVK